MGEEMVFLKQGRAAENKRSQPRSFSLFISCLVLCTLKLHHSHPYSWSQPHWVILCFLWHRDSLDTHWILTQTQALHAWKTELEKVYRLRKGIWALDEKAPRPPGSCWTDAMFYFMQNSVIESRVIWGNFVCSQWCTTSYFAESQVDWTLKGGFPLF